MKKKVAIIIERANITLGGAERSVLELTAALTTLDYEVKILAAKGQEKAEYTCVLCNDIRGERVKYHVFENHLKRHLKENYYDIIHSVLPFDFADIYQPRGGAYPETILRNAASYQNSFIKSFKRTTSFFNVRRKTLMKAEKRICEIPNGPVVIAISDYVAKQFKRHYNIYDNRMITIPNGVEVDRQIDEEAITNLRTRITRQLKIKKNDKPVYFLFAANNFRLKGLTPLLKAMQKVLLSVNKSRKFCLIVAGKDRDYKYKQIAKKLKISDMILFLGYIENIQNLLEIANVAILPTYYDPASRFILEALAAGIPVITTQFNGAMDLFSNNRHGKVIDTPVNINALSEAISYFTETKNIQNASQAILADDLKQKVSVNRVANQLESVYNSIFSAKKRDGYL